MRSRYFGILIAILAIVIVSGCVGQTPNTSSGSNNVSTQQTSNTTSSSALQKLIDMQESQVVANPPASLTRCLYHGQVVYFLPQRCCDIPSVLYGESGSVICSPDGGITGQGNRAGCSDFKMDSSCVVVWKDNRTEESETKRSCLESGGTIKTVNNSFGWWPYDVCILANGTECMAGTFQQGQCQTPPLDINASAKKLCQEENLTNVSVCNIFVKVPDKLDANKVEFYRYQPEGTLTLHTTCSLDNVSQLCGQLLDKVCDEQIC